MKTIQLQTAALFGCLMLLSMFWGVPEGRAQGSLLPPGPPGPTMKTLEQIEPRLLISSLPFVITSPGSYCLTTNLSGSAGQHGVMILADNVTLDLNGFVLAGVPGSSNGIACPGPCRNLVVRNGTIREWGGHGVDAAQAEGCRLERLEISANGGRGIQAGSRAQVENSVADGNGDTGIHAGPFSTVRACAASDNGRHGLFADTGSNVIDSTATGNQFDGVSVGAGSRIQGCVARGNTEDGFSGSTEVVLSDCVAQENEGWGIRLANGAKVSGASASGNGEIGIQVEDLSHVNDCLARSNEAGGIFMGSGGTVRGCTAVRNGGDGIRVAAECLVFDNQCHGNDNVIDSAGIHATGAKNQIRDNSLTSNVRGLSIDVDGNFVVRNAASNNTLNYRRTPNQTMGTVLPGLDDPASQSQAWANFAY